METLSGSKPRLFFMGLFVMGLFCNVPFNMGTSIEVSGKLSDDRFAKMPRRYEDEQKELTEKIDGVWEQM